MKWFSRIIFVVISCLIALTTNSYCQISPSKAAESYARKAIAHFSSGEIEAGLEMLDPAVLPENIEEIADGIHRILAGLSPGYKIIRVNWFSFKSFSKDFRYDKFAFHLIGETSAALGFTRVETENGSPILRRFHLEPAPIDLMDRYPFVFKGVSLLHYACLLILVLIPVAMVFTAISAIRSKLRWKWLWAVLSFVGVGQVSLYWISGPFSTAMIKTKLLKIALLGLGFQKYPLYDPWSLTFSVPLGAMLVYFKIKSIGKKSVTHNGNEAATSEPKTSTADPVQL